MEALRRGRKADWDTILSDCVNRQILITSHDGHTSTSKAARANSRDSGKPKLELWSVPTNMFALWRWASGQVHSLRFVRARAGLGDVEKGDEASGQ